MFLMPGSRAQKQITVIRNPLYRYQTLPDAPTITWDLDQGVIAAVTLGGNRTIAIPIGRHINKGACTAILQIFQPASGGPFTVTWAGGYMWPGGVAPVLSTAASARDIFSFVQVIGGNMAGNYMNAVA